ncbi:hypothetical protein [Vulcaniibacterium gelatinicum]|uniref:hypothetical protein n=1 Tax=Vulcaniibacterium gelatinicum TaxID=2598725 RepID=UPI0011CB5D88|nr:hypothetical protein [Vulcaniibacterium gelatinicum]
MPAGARAWLLAASAAAALPATAGGDAATARHALTAALETSDVRIGARDATWRAQWLQWDLRGAHGGLFAVVERRTREQAHGELATAGGHWLGERWILSGQLESGSGAAFVPRRAGEAHAGYRLGPAHTVRLGYRHADYPGSALRLWSFSSLHYRGDDEWEIGYRHGSTSTAGRERIAFGLVRGQWACGARWSCGLRLAGGENVFGADEPGFDTGTGWQAGGFLAYRLAGGHSLRLDLGTGRGTRFRQDSLTLSYRHAFAR